MGIDKNDPQGITGAVLEELNEKRRKAAERKRRSRANRKEKALAQDSDWPEIHDGRELFPAGRYFIPTAYRCTRRKEHESECVIELTNYVRFNGCFKYFSTDCRASPEGFHWREEVLKSDAETESKFAPSEQNKVQGENGDKRSEMS